MEINKSLPEIIADLYRTFFDLIRNFSHLVTVEIQQAKWTIAKSALLIFTLMMLMSFTWLGICSVICISLTKHGLDLASSVLCVTALNAILLMITMTYLFSLNRNSLFRGTTRKLQVAMNQGKDAGNE